MLFELVIAFVIFILNDASASSCKAEGSPTSQSRPRATPSLDLFVHASGVSVCSVFGGAFGCFLASV
ncbi:hypothetical protein PF005_g27717 [Phytophthora fragariae]|uniref:Secreted protein n=1 Tax=Phytophthora fragariae TaxID=53985 RepID=A0A6A3Q7H3_9STRA|nr:hypothetical protein PF003_g36965 [Phytophthora fragariae]KAE8919810.1 hypothetical protein PF009_g29889 [Phytophthora fragariae]KAE8964785.1 hypothetical protein PF011_g28541 [Phytophthora fragariae]KAE9067789.1 hypothetical protein PF010_g27327 [Phytophthora fragariae]KAE9070535.1 hypothetical protein PF007_g26907 [Phytophthora fragariae]